MGKLAQRTKDGLEPKQAVKVKSLIKEGEIDLDEVVYEIQADGMKKLEPGDTVEPGKKYGVVPRNDVGA